LQSAGIASRYSIVGQRFRTKIHLNFSAIHKGITVDRTSLDR
jgi:hypothetical protein